MNRNSIVSAVNKRGAAIQLSSDYYEKAGISAVIAIMRHMISRLKRCWAVEMAGYRKEGHGKPCYKASI